jgi:hypothetical protein
MTLSFALMLLGLTLLAIAIVFWLSGFYERGRPSNEELPPQKRSE